MSDALSTRIVRPSNLIALLGGGSVWQRSFPVAREKGEREEGGEVDRVAWSFCCLLDVVHRGDSFLSIILVGVTDEAEATASTCVTILDDHLYIMAMRLHGQTLSLFVPT